MVSHCESNTPEEIKARTRKSKQQIYMREKSTIELGNDVKEMVGENL